LIEEKRKTSKKPQNYIRTQTQGSSIKHNDWRETYWNSNRLCHLSVKWQTDVITILRLNNLGREILMGFSFRSPPKRFGNH